MKAVLTLLLFAFTHAFAMAQNNKIVGVWWNDLLTSRIEVFEKDGKFYGKINWLKNDTNPDGSAPRLDLENPEKEMRSRKIIGLLILKNLVWDEKNNEWIGGEIYSPAHGKTFSCYAKLASTDKLVIKGYILGMPLLGSSTTWTKYN